MKWKHKIIYILLIASICILAFIVCIPKRKQTIKEAELTFNVQEKYVFEYGEVLPMDVKAYAQVEDTSMYEEMEVAINIDLEKDKAYPKVGMYTGVIVYKDRMQSFFIEVIDTIAPTFIQYEENVYIKQTQQFSTEDLIQTCVVEDISGVESVYVEGTWNVLETNTYTVQISAKDIYGNIASIVVQVIVYEDVVENTNNVYKEDSYIEKKEAEEEKEEVIVYTLPSTFVDEDGATHEFFYLLEDAHARFLQLEDARYHMCYFDDYITSYYELIWWEEQ